MRDICIVRSSKWSLSFRFLHQNPVWFSLLPSMCLISPTPLILALLALILVIFSGTYKSRSPQYAVFISILVLRTVFGPDMFLSTLHVNTLAYIHILHLHKIRGKILVPHILIFMFFRQYMGRHCLWIFVMAYSKVTVKGIDNNVSGHSKYEI